MEGMRTEPGLGDWDPLHPSSASASTQHRIRAKKLPPALLMLKKSKVSNLGYSGHTPSLRGKRRVNAACQTFRATQELPDTATTTSKVHNATPQRSHHDSQPDPAVFRETGSSCPTTQPGSSLPGWEWQAKPPKDAVGVMSSRHCRPAVTISGPFPPRLPGTAGSCGKREAGREERAGKQQLLPWMSAGRKAVGREGRRSSLQAWGAESVRVAKAAQSLQPSSALPAPEGSTGVRARALQGALLHQRAAKGGALPVYEPFYTPRAVCTTLM